MPKNTRKARVWLFWSYCKQFLVYCHYCCEYLQLFYCYNLSSATKWRDSLVKTCCFVNNEFYHLLEFLINFLSWQKENFISKHFFLKEKRDWSLKSFTLRTLFNIYGCYLFLVCIFLYFYRKQIYFHRKFSVSN